MSRAALLGLILATGALQGVVDPEAAPSKTAASPLTNEDIVRLVASGVPESEILARIAARPADFDLSPEMVAELKAAGVSGPIVEAMRGRQAQMPRPEATPTPAPSPGLTGTLEIDFADDPGAVDRSGRAVIAIRSLPPRATRRGGMEVGEVTDLALAVLCLSADHVPDHWDARTPLTGAPRHELLLFRPGSASESLKKIPILSLQHEPSYRLELPEGAHQIVVAAAGKSSGSGAWRLIASDGARLTIARGQTARLMIRARGALRGNAMTGYGVDNEWKVAVAGESRAPEAAPAAGAKQRAGPSSPDGSPP